MRKHGRRDANHSEIVNALRGIGASVLDLADVGNAAMWAAKGITSPIGVWARGMNLWTCAICVTSATRHNIRTERVYKYGKR